MPPRQFGISVVLIDGSTYSAGDAHTSFSTQSVTNLFTFVMALKLVGDDLWSVWAATPQARALQLAGAVGNRERQTPQPVHQFRRAGDCRHPHQPLHLYAHRLLSVLRRLTDNVHFELEQQSAQSEIDTGHRNMAMAFFMKSYDNFNNAPELVLENYCRQCAIEMTCAQLAQATMFLANDGQDITRHGRAGNSTSRPAPPAASTPHAHLRCL